MAFETLNKLRWTGKLAECEVVILHRGAPHDQKTIPGSKITQVKKSHFYYKDGAGGRESFIPLHRVLIVRLRDEVIWKRSTRRG